jgi:hypothetical protein
MKGIQFVVDEKGERQAVLIDLAEWGELWEDFYDVLVARSRQEEEEVSWQELKQEFEADGIR